MILIVLVRSFETRASEHYPLCSHTHPQNLLVAAGTGGSEELLVAVFAVHLALLLHEAIVGQRGVAVGTGELLGVPRLTHGHKERAPGNRKQEQRKADYWQIMRFWSQVETEVEVMTKKPLYYKIYNVLEFLLSIDQT